VVNSLFILLRAWISAFCTASIL